MNTTKNKRKTPANDGRERKGKKPFIKREKSVETEGPKDLSLLFPTHRKAKQKHHAIDLPFIEK